MTRERMVIFLIAFFLLFSLSSSIILGSEIAGESGFRGIINTVERMKDTDINIPVIGGAVVAFLVSLAAYIGYREFRGGF